MSDIKILYTIMGYYVSIDAISTENARIASYSTIQEKFNILFSILSWNLNEKIK